MVDRREGAVVVAYPEAINKYHSDSATVSRVEFRYLCAETVEYADPEYKCSWWEQEELWVVAVAYDNGLYERLKEELSDNVRGETVRSIQDRCAFITKEYYREVRP